MKLIDSWADTGSTACETGCSATSGPCSNEPKIGRVSVAAPAGVSGSAAAAVSVRKEVLSSGEKLGAVLSAAELSEVAPVMRLCRRVSLGRVRVS